MESYGARLIFISIFLQTLIEQLSIAPPFERMFIFAVKLSASWGSRSVFHFFSSESWFIFARVSTCLPTPTTRMQMNAEWWVEKRPDAPVPGSGSSHAWRVSIGDVGSGSEADGGVGGGRGRHKRRFLKRPVDAGRHQPRAAPRLEKDVALYFFFFLCCALKTTLLRPPPSVWMPNDQRRRHSVWLRPLDARAPTEIDKINPHSCVADPIGVEWRRIHRALTSVTPTVELRLDLRSLSPWPAVDERPFVN